MALYDTAGAVISDAALELGLGEVSDAFGSSDANVVRLRGLLKSAGRQLFLENTWLQQHREHVFTTDGSVSYALPDDFSRMLDQTGWNRTMRLPALPASPQEWQFLSAVTTGVIFTVFFRPADGVLKVWPTGSSGMVIAFEYASRYWVRSSGSVLVDKDAPSANDDTIFLDALLAVKALKLAFMRATGFDTTAAQGELDQALAAVKSAGISSAPKLTLNKETTGLRLLDGANAPAAGYGLDGGGLF